MIASYWALAAIYSSGVAPQSVVLTCSSVAHVLFQARDRHVKLGGLSWSSLCRDRQAELSRRVGDGSRSPRVQEPKRNVAGKSEFATQANKDTSLA